MVERARLGEKDCYLPSSEKPITRFDFLAIFGNDYEKLAREELKQLGVLVDGQEITFFTQAKRHEGSSGLYLVEEIVGNSWIFVQAMLSHGISTKHLHQCPVTELYVPQIGESTLEVDGEEIRLQRGRVFEVLSGQVHQLKADSKPSLNLLIMKNSAHIPRNKLHIPIV